MREAGYAVHGKKLEDDLKERYHVGMDKTLAQMAVQLQLMGFDVNTDHIVIQDRISPFICMFHREYCEFGIINGLEFGTYTLYLPISTKNKPFEELSGHIDALNRRLLITQLHIEVQRRKVVVIGQAIFRSQYSGKLFENFIFLFMNDERVIRSEIGKFLIVSESKSKAKRKTDVFPISERKCKQ